MHKAGKKEQAGKLAILIVLIILPVAAWLFYSGLFVFGKINTGSSEKNYFKDLAVSFKHGRLDIDIARGEITDDLSNYRGKYYLYWPPVPAIVYMGLTAPGRNTPDNLITATFGALNTALITAFFFLFSKKYALDLKPVEILFLSVFWAFGTVHFYMSMLGSVWFISQTMAQTFLLASILSMLYGSSPASLILSSLFYSAAVYTRNDLVFTAFFLAAVHINNRGKEWKKYAVRDALIFILPFACFSVLNMAYNAARFDGMIFDDGVTHNKLDPYFLQSFFKHGVMSVFYIPYNFYSEVIKPMPISAHFPFFSFSFEGFGFLWASPLFFFLIPAAYYFRAGAKRVMAKKTKIGGPLNRPDIIVMAGAAISGAGTALIIFMMIGNGWVQFASRYSLDFQLMALVFMLFLVKIWRGGYFYTTAVVLLALSIYIEYFGVRYFV
jgi:hypothetical protein